MFRAFLAAIAATSAAACTSTPQVPVIEPRDTHLACTQIAQESEKLQSVMAEAHHNKGFNLANFFAVPLFPPAYHNNFIEADNAEEWVQRRRVMLTELYIQKGCAPGITPRGVGTQTSVDRQAVYDSAVRGFQR